MITSPLPEGRLLMFYDFVTLFTMQSCYIIFDW